MGKRLRGIRACSLEEKRNQLEDDLEEKKQAVRHLQLRSNEMKKMIQKEMKSGTGDPVNSICPNR